MRISDKILSAACFFFLCGLASAVTLSQSTTAPVPDNADISQLVGTQIFGNDNFDGVWGDRPAQGQTFLTLGNPLGYSLSAVTFRMGLTDPPGNNFILRLGTVSGNAFTELFDQQSSNTAVPTNNDYVRFQFDTPIVLLPNTMYGIDAQGSDNSPTGFRMLSNLNNSVYANGAAYSSGDGNGGNATITLHAGDRLFHLDLVAVPEPASLALAGLAAIGFMAVARRHSRRPE